MDRRIVAGMPTITKTFSIRAIAPEVVAGLRERDDAGRRPEPFVDRDGDNPLRCCNRLSRPGERIVLASYAPLHRWAAVNGVDPGAYDETGPVFLHADPCHGPAHDRFPDDYRGLPRVLRPYDADGRILDGLVIAAGDMHPEDAIDKVFSDPRVAFIHARALLAGCFTFAIDRVSA
jgi:hypothetical protein